jgi:hypothetical protein
VPFEEQHRRQIELDRHCTRRRAANCFLHSKLLVHEIREPAPDREIIQAALRSVIEHALLIAVDYGIEDVLPR